MTVRICVVAEDRSGAELAWTLSERALERAAEWFADADMETRRSMRERVDASSDRWFFRVSDVPDRYRVPESEAWRIALVDREARAAEIATLRKELGFDPVAEPHELSSAPTSKKEAKTVAARLYGNEPPPIDDRALDVLSRHEVAGAASYLRDLQTAVVAPIVGGRAS